MADPDMSTSRFKHRNMATSVPKMFAKVKIGLTIKDTNTPTSTIPCNNTFKPFPYLPLELKLKIFRLTVSPRIVEVRLSKSLQAYDFVADVHLILHICRDSRMEGLRIYKTLESKTTKSSYARLQPLIDTLYLRNLLNLGEFHYGIEHVEAFVQEFTQKDLIYTLAVPFSFATPAYLLDFIHLRKLISICPLSHQRTQSHDSECTRCVSAPANRTILLSIEDYFAHADAFGHPNTTFPPSYSKENTMSIIDLDRKAFAVELEFLAREKRVSPWGTQLPTIEYMATFSWKISEENLHLDKGN